MRWIAVLALLAVTMAGRAPGQTCAGDCNGSESVSIDELVRGVSLALGLRGEVCAAMDVDADGGVEINELVAAVASALNGCGGTEPATPANVVRRYADLLYATYGDALSSAQTLRTAIEAFLAAPSATGLDAARQAWIAARPAYLQTEMARFYDGPIDNAEDGVESFVNSWPLDEAYIDYVAGDASAGIINRPDLYPTIDRALLLQLNEGESETTISTGWHAIEFLLWGQDRDPNGPGNRPFTDYVTDGSGTAANQARRATYLRVAAQLLVDDLITVQTAWAPGGNNYRRAFLALDTQEALRRILTGLGTLSGGELTGERMSVAFETKDQEDEHSCFSDNTTADFHYDEVGIQNGFFGDYGGESGVGIFDLVRAVNAPLAEQTRDAIQSTLSAILQIPAPFDQAILGSDSAPGRVAIANALDHLNVQTDLIAQCAAALGISISTTSP